MQGAPFQPVPQTPKKSNTLVIVLGIIAGIFIIGGAACAGCVFYAKNKAEEGLQSLADGGGLMLTSPEAVTTALAGPKKGYVGRWVAADGSTLQIDEDGHMRLEKKAGNQKTDAPIAAFVGDDIQVKLFVTITYKVSKAPAPGGTEIVVDGLSFKRQ
jgi:hypothetical protein